MKKIITGLLLINCFFAMVIPHVLSADLTALSYSFLGVKQTEESIANSPLNILNMVYGNIEEGQASSGGSDSTLLLPTAAEAKLSKGPYFYPSSFRLSDGSTLGYSLSKDMDIEIRIYNIRGNQIYRDFYMETTEGGKGAGVTGIYNKVPFNQNNLGNLPSGVYFVVVINEGKVLGKGKFAILP